MTVKTTSNYKSKFDFRGLVCFFVGLLVVANGIFNYLLGEILSEGLALLITFGYLIIRVRIHESMKLPLLVYAIIIFIAFNFIGIIFLDEWSRALFLYPYVFLLLLILQPIYHEHAGNDISYLVKTLTIFACISSCYAVAQRIGIETILPLEGELRATGLSRSSLNLTGCLLAIFGVGIITLKDNYLKLISQSTIFLGILAAGGRGGIISALLLVVIVYIKKYNNIKFFLIGSILSISVTVFLWDWFWRAFSALNFVSDQSNLDRMESYLNFLSEYSLLGSGIGTTSPAALRFHDATGFESSLLNTIYEVGLSAFLFLIIYIVWYKNISKDSKDLLLKFLIGISPVIVGQQLYGIPSAFCTLILAIFILASYRKPLN